MRFNRIIVPVFFTREGAGREISTELVPEGGYIGIETPERLPLDISCSFTRSITSHNDSATVTVKNAVQIEQIYEQNAFFFQDFSRNQYEVGVLASHLDGTNYFNEVFTGDITGLSVSGDSITDQSLSFTAAAGYYAMRHGIGKHIFEPETSYREIIKYVFDEVLFPEYGIELRDDNIVDPDGLLDNVKLRPFTVSGPVERVLTDITKGLHQAENTNHFGYTWGIGTYFDGAIQAYFVDKRAVFDIQGENEPREVNYQTGKTGRVSFNRTSFDFSHLQDNKLRIGNEVILSDFPSINSPAVFRGRVDSISANISNYGDSSYNVTCSYIGDDGLAVLDGDRALVTGYRL